MKKLIAILLSLVLLVSFVGCTTEPVTSSEKLSIVTTLFPQYDFCREIVGDKAEVKLLLPPGVESHTFEPTTADIIEIEKCDVFIYTGDSMEAWAGRIIGSLNNANLRVVDISENIEMKEAESDHEHHSHERDPHVWTSPENAMKIVQHILRNLIEADPENKDYYTQNANNYIRKLGNLDIDFENLIENSNKDKIIFGGRCAFLYFLEEYDLDYMSAYASCSTENEPSADNLTNIIDTVKREKISAIYYEELTDPKIGRTLCKETGAELLLLHSCHNVSKEDFENGVTYLSLMQQNLENLRKGLQ
ncbi:MAG: zinc ABC transporter substrate-binding protein [Clostridia bacterium]|nr:zinc ABC transporter substrate-binding protein [Clostridia bacterium]